MIHICAANHHFVGGVAAWRENPPMAGLRKGWVLGFKCAERGIGLAASGSHDFNVGPARV